MSTTVFLKCQDKYLFLLRSPHKTVDPNRLNGVGGKLEPGENYLDAAIRETQEETGYPVEASQAVFLGLTQLKDGYADDWLAAFFLFEVDTFEIPIGNDTREGQLMWLPPDEILTSPHELVDDLHNIWPEIIQGRQFFLQATLNNQEKITQYSLTTL